MVTTLIARRAQFHQVYMVAHITQGQPTFTRAAKALTIRFASLGGGGSGPGVSRAASQAYNLLYRTLIGQATTLAYIDTFWILSVGAGIMFLLSFALRRNDPGTGGEVAAG